MNSDPLIIQFVASRYTDYATASSSLNMCIQLAILRSGMCASVRIGVTEERCWALFYMPLYKFLKNLLNVLVRIENEVGVQKKNKK
jgi:hypothetical protein